MTKFIYLFIYFLNLFICNVHNYQTSFTYKREREEKYNIKNNAISLVQHNTAHLRTSEAPFKDTLCNTRYYIRVYNIIKNTALLIC